MPLVNVKLIEGVFDAAQKRGMTIAPISTRSARPSRSAQSAERAPRTRGARIRCGGRSTARQHGWAEGSKERRHVWPFLSRCGLAITATLTIAGPIGLSGAAADPPPAPGSLDFSFDGDGIVQTSIGDAGQGTAMAVQPDGGIVVVGFSEQGSATGRDFVVARYNPDGSLDSSFGGDGTVAVPIGPGVSRDEAYAVALQADGRIVVAGETWEGTTSIHHAALARLNTDGSLDGAFGGDGTVVTPMGTSSTARGVVVQPDGRIVIAGAGTELSGGVGTWIALSRRMPDGSLDSSFAGGGTVFTTIGSSSVAHAMTMQPDGRLVLAGQFRGGSITFLIVLRYGADGSTDTSFAGSGNVQHQIDSNTINVATALDIAPDGNIVVAGFVASPFKMVLLRLRPAGGLDPAFDGDGIVTIAPGGFGQAFGVKVDSAGRPIMTGDTAGVGTDVGLVRHLGTGALDPSFGDGGVVVTNVGTGNNHGRAVAIQADDRILVAGHNTNPVHALNVLRFHGDTPVRRLTVAPSGSGTGTVASDPAGIACGLDCTEDYDPGITVELTATAAVGSYFAGWSGACSGTQTCPVTMDEDRNVTATFELDTTPPDTTITSGPGALTTDMTPTFEFTADETGATFECAVDDGTFASCTSPHTTGPLAGGGHTFAVRATDQAANSDPSPATRSFTVDMTPPDTAITSASPPVSADNTPMFSFASTEAGSTFTCQMDGAASFACSSPQTAGPLATGPHTFAVYATDAAGNADLSPATMEFRVRPGSHRPR